MTRLHVNIDHVATLRQARGVDYPNPVSAVNICEMAGADGITVHLREDRRHIQDRDLKLIKQVVTTRLNFEMAATAEMIEIARSVRPYICTLVPEKREERTTEGGLEVAGDLKKITDAANALHKARIKVSLFVDPKSSQITASKDAGADMVEIHTGDFCNAEDTDKIKELNRIIDSAHLAKEINLQVAAGHGLHYHNVLKISEIDEIEELNIGHSIISRAVFTGLKKAVTAMLAAMKK